MLLCIGGASTFNHYREIRLAREEYARNDELIDGMLDAQNAGVKGNADDVALGAPLSDAAALASEASTRLNRPVPLIDLKPSGWTLDAAAFCSIDKSPAARFHFTKGTKGTQTCTVVSLPATVYSGAKEGKQYDFDADGQPIAGYIKSGSLNCVIGDKSLTIPEVIALRDQIIGG